LSDNISIIKFTIFELFSKKRLRGGIHSPFRLSLSPLFLFMFLEDDTRVASHVSH